MYEVLSGMTGTAATEAEEFRKIYKLDVVVIPTHKTMIRKDHSDMVYKTLRAKYGAIVAEIEDKHKKGQPVLVGTTSIDKNEIIDEYLKRKKIPHNVLNAKNHEGEAMIIADAGKLGAVTVATNMAGRGVDIILGGTPPDMPARSASSTADAGGPPGMDREKHKETKEYMKWKEDHKIVIEAGGLHVIGTERHESRRIDNQLRGRSGRQGDPGSSRFYLSLEDDLMRIFGGEQIGSLMDRLKLPEEQPIENKLVSRAIEQAQVKVEGFHFDARKNLVEYDNVINQQREIIYKLRQSVLEGKNLKEEILEKLANQVDNIILLSQSVDSDSHDAEKLLVHLMEIIPFDDASRARIKSHLKKVEDKGEIKEFLVKMINDVYTSREKDLGEELVRQVEKFAYLGSIDKQWIEHIDHLDGLREGVRLRAYGQRDPLVEFKNEAFNLFEGLIDRIDSELSHRIFRIGVARAPRPEIPIEAATTNVDTSDATGLIDTVAPELGAEGGQPAFSDTPPLRPPVDGRAFGVNLSKGNIQGSGSTDAKKKIGRNDPCPCGSGKKYKKCHYPQYG